MNARPLYQRVKDHILARIESGAWSPGDLVSSESALVRELGASRMTVNRALRELTQEGLLVREQGRGTFVAETAAPSEFLELRNVADEIRESGRRYGARLVHLAPERVAAQLAAAMELSSGTEVFRSVIVHLADGVPLQVEDRLVNPACAPGYLEVDFATMTPNEYLMAVAPLDQVEHIVEAVLPEPAIRKLLDVGASEPCLRLQRRTWSRGAVASRAILTYPGSAHRFGTRFAYRRSTPPLEPESRA
jgi:GntR family histidine utilization transcriptional repressor